MKKNHHKIIKDNIITIITGMIILIIMMIMNHNNGREGIFGLGFGIIMITMIALIIGWIMIIIPIPEITITGIIIIGASLLIGGPTLIIMINNTVNKIPGGWTTIIIISIILFFKSKIFKQKKAQYF